jgi:hypothetical protein
MMPRAKRIWACLLPTFWLVASITCFAGPVSICSCDQELVSSSQNEEHHCSSPLGSPEQMLMRTSRRITGQSCVDAWSIDAAVSGWPLTRLQSLVSPYRNSQNPLDLIQRWQFQQRTALEPRAPALVS